MQWLKSTCRAAFLLLLCSSTVNAIGIRIDTPYTGTLEDAVLFASVGGNAPYTAVPLGDLVISTPGSTGFVFNVPVNPADTSWWLLGHQGSTVVYSSVQNLSGVQFDTIQPYNGLNATAWNIPAQLDGYVNGTGYSVEWFVQTELNHQSHVAADNASASLYSFSSPGVLGGTVTVSLTTNTVPGGNGQGVPDSASTAVLLLAGLAALACVRRR